jgi:hypothetical protein
MAKRPNGTVKRHVKSKYKSGLEDNNVRLLKDKGVPVNYETLIIEWEDLAYRTYKPDFPLPNGIIVETKGQFDNEDRRKHLAIKKQHPELDIRFVFTYPNAKLYKGSKTTYADWCNKHGFQYAAKLIPDEWLEEEGQPINVDRILLKYERIER